MLYRYDRHDLDMSLAVCVLFSTCEKVTVFRPIVLLVSSPGRRRYIDLTAAGLFPPSNILLRVFDTKKFERSSHGCAASSLSPNTHSDAYMCLSLPVLLQNSNGARKGYMCCVLESSSRNWWMMVIWAGTFQKVQKVHHGKTVLNTVLAVKQRELRPASLAEAIRSGEVCPEMMLPQTRGDCNNEQQLNSLLVEK